MVDITWYDYSIHGLYKPTFTSLEGTKVGRKISTYETMFRKPSLPDLHERPGLAGDGSLEKRQPFVWRKSSERNSFTYPIITISCVYKYNLLDRYQICLSKLLHIWTWYGNNMDMTWGISGNIKLLSISRYGHSTISSNQTGQYIVHSFHSYLLNSQRVLTNIPFTSL